MERTKSKKFISYKMFDFFNTKEKLSHSLRKLLLPSKAFKEQTKMAFLAVFDAAHPETRSAHSITAVAKTFIAGGALLGIFAGMSVYADTANVAADSTLYPLKRLSENVQLALAPPVEKPQLQATFAARRAVEISDLSTRKPTSTIIVDLDKDLDSDVNNSISAAVATNLSDGKLNDFCGTVLSAIATSSVSIPGRSVVRARALTRFEGECAVDSSVTSTFDIGNATTTINIENATDTKHGKDDNTSGTDGGRIFKVKNSFSHLHLKTATTTVQSTSSDEINVTDVTNATGTVDIPEVASRTIRVRGGGLLNIIFENPSKGRGHDKQRD